MPVSYKWSLIEDLTNASALTDGELSALLEVWKDQRDALADDHQPAEFSQRLDREWAIETGIIERAYTLDRGTTETLIAEGIKASLISHDSTDRDPEELAAILQDHLDALEGLFAFVKGERELTVGYIKEVHSVLLRHVNTYTVRDSAGNFSERELIKGAYKTQPNSPTRPDGSVHEYCPPEHVASEMDRLVELHKQHSANNVAPEVEAAWLHHRFTQIHPFSDGNGRVARILASLIFIKREGFPLLVKRDETPRYIGALEAADQEDLGPLVSFFRGAERRALLQALQALPRTMPRDAITPATPEGVIAGVRQLLVRRGDEQVIPEEWETTFALVSPLHDRAQQRFNSVAQSLRNEIGRFKNEFKFTCRNPDSETLNALKKNFSSVSESLGYEIASTGYRVVMELDLQTNDQWKIGLSWHGVGKHYRGVLAGLLIFVKPDGTAVSASDGPFQVNYKDQSQKVQTRFSNWLEQGLIQALVWWREQI